MKKTANKSLAVLLALVMLFTCIGANVYASDEVTTGYEVLRSNSTMYGDTQTQRAFTWVTEKNCDTTLELCEAYGFTGDFTNALTFTGEATVFEGYYYHKVVATGLEPGITYYYRVGSYDFDTWSNIGKFVADDGDGKFSFIAIADVQASNMENFKSAANVMEKAMLYTPNAEFAINLGDFVNDCTNEEWNMYGETFEKANLGMTLVPVAGNHEGNITDSLNIGWFDSMFNLNAGDGVGNGINGTYYSYDYGNAHFCVVNSNDMYPMVEAQRNWIINDLTNSDAQWKILLMHRAPYSAGKNIAKPDTLAMRETIIEIVDQTDVDLVLSGHDHMYFRTKQVKGDAVCEDTVYETINYQGEEYVAAVNPEGATYILPSTAGTKRYSVNDSIPEVVKNAAEVSLSLSGKGGCFSNITIDGDKLIYNAYVVLDENPEEVIKFDSYAIVKTEKGEAGESDLPTDFIGTIDGSFANFFSEIFGLLIKYIKMIPELIGGLF